MARIGLATFFFAYTSFFKIYYLYKRARLYLELIHIMNLAPLCQSFGPLIGHGLVHLLDINRN